MIDRGRKAGLKADELYRALSAGRPSSEPLGKPDGNGFIEQVQADGKRTYEPPAEDGTRA
jgi:hypothetical protein